MIVNPFSIYPICFCEQRSSCLTSGLLQTMSMPNPLLLMSDLVFLWKSYKQSRVLEIRENFWRNITVFSNTFCSLLAIQTCICCWKSCSALKKSSSFSKPARKKYLCKPKWAVLCLLCLDPAQILPHLLPPYHLVPSTYLFIPSLISLGLASKSWGGKADSDTSWDCAADITGKSSLGSCRTRSYCQSIWLK